MTMAASLAFDCESSADARNVTLGPLGIDYLHIHYCFFAGAPLVSFAALTAWLCLLFFFLGSTADGYFSPTLASISEKLHVPYDVAGVTFLAFGNGAPDVFSAIAAYSSDVEEAGINELLGGSIFVSTVVVGCVAVASVVDVQQWAFSRDVLALIGSLILLLVLGARSSSSKEDLEPDLSQLLFILAYIVYVTSVVLPVCLTKIRRHVSHDIKAGSDDSSLRGVLSAFWLALSPRGHGEKLQEYAFVTKTGGCPGSPLGQELGSPRRKSPYFTSDVVEDHFQDFTDDSSLSSPLIADEDRHEDSEDLAFSARRATFSNGARIIDSAYWRHVRWRWRLKRRIVQLRGGSESWLVKVLSLPNILLITIRDITVPLLDPDTWSRTVAAISLISVPQLLLWATGFYEATIEPSDTPLWLVLLALGSTAAIGVSYTTHRSRPPESLTYCLLFLLIAFVACVCWIYTVASELVALLVAVGTITHASNSLLGLTVLSWGNSVGDLITNVSVARAGFPEMAIAGCYGGPVFNILLGVGIPMLLAFFRGEDQLMGFDVHAWISLGFLFISLVSSYWVFRWYNFRCPTWYGKVLLVHYSAYAAVNVAVALRKKVVQTE